MELAELQQLVAEGESERLEFKRSTGELHAGMETLCALLNGSGGNVLFGVTNSGRIVGQDISDSTLQEVAAGIRKIEPHAWIDQTRIPVGEGREVLMLETTLQADAPYVFDGRPYQRIGPSRKRSSAPA